MHPYRRPVSRTRGSRASCRRHRSRSPRPDDPWRRTAAAPGRRARQHSHGDRPERAGVAEGERRRKVPSVDGAWPRPAPCRLRPRGAGSGRRCCPRRPLSRPRSRTPWRPRCARPGGHRQYRRDPRAQTGPAQLHHRHQAGVADQVPLVELGGHLRESEKLHLADGFLVRLMGTSTVIILPDQGPSAPQTRAQSTPFMRWIQAQ
jgi:hypothetical protein